VTRRTLLLALTVVTLGVLLWPRKSVTWPIRNAPPGAGPIVCFGDSLTRGDGAQPKESYPAVLAGLLGTLVRVRCSVRRSIHHSGPNSVTVCSNNSGQEEGKPSCARSPTSIVDLEESRRRVDATVDLLAQRGRQELVSRIYDLRRPGKQPSPELGEELLRGTWFTAAGCIRSPQRC
jgi:hypothetical protein